MSLGIVRNVHRVVNVFTVYCFNRTQYPRIILQSIHLPRPLLTTNREKRTYLAQDSPKRGILSKILRKLGWLNLSHRNLKRSAFYLYETVADGLNYLPFFKELELEDTFFSWFLITELHVWMLLVRVMAEGEEGRFVRNSIVEAMWTDVSTRASKLEDGSSSRIKKEMVVLSEQFQAAIIGYDEGLLSDDRVLAGAIWRRFFKQECSNPELIECLVRYVREQVKQLDETPSEKILVKPSIMWIPLEPVNARHL